MQPSAAPLIPDPSAVWRAHYAASSGYRYWPNEELVRAVGGRRFGLAVEAGCGNGANLWYLAEHAECVLGVDACAEALAAAQAYMRQRGAANVVVQAGDLTALPAATASADLLADIMTSQHVPWSGFPGVLAEYRRVLKTGGVLFLCNLGHGTTNRGGRRLETFTWDQLPDVFPGIGPVCLPQRPALLRALCEAGFSPSCTRQLSRTYANGAATVYHVTEAAAT